MSWSRTDHVPGELAAQLERGHTDVTHLPRCVQLIDIVDQLVRQRVEPWCIIGAGQCQQEVERGQGLPHPEAGQRTHLPRTAQEASGRLPSTCTRGTRICWSRPHYVTMSLRLDMNHCDHPASAFWVLGSQWWRHAWGSGHRHISLTRDLCIQTEAEFPSVMLAHVPFTLQSLFYDHPRSPLQA